MGSDPIIWTGDLEDDCHAEWRDCTAQVERKGDWWLCVVWTGGEELYRGRLTCGEDARRTAEMAMRAHDAEARTDLPRAMRLIEAGERLANVVQNIAAKHVCAMCCPKVTAGMGAWPHSDECLATKAALAAYHRAQEGEK